MVARCTNVQCQYGTLPLQRCKICNDFPVGLCMSDRATPAAAATTTPAVLSQGTDMHQNMQVAPSPLLLHTSTPPSTALTKQQNCQAPAGLSAATGDHLGAAVQCANTRVAGAPQTTGSLGGHSLQCLQCPSHASGTHFPSEGRNQQLLRETHRQTNLLQHHHQHAVQQHHHQHTGRQQHQQQRPPTSYNIHQRLSPSAPTDLEAMDQLFDELLLLSSGMHRTLNNSPAVHFETFIPAAAAAAAAASASQKQHPPGSSLPTTAGSPSGMLEHHLGPSDRQLPTSGRVTPVLPMSLQQQSRSSTPPGGAVSAQQLACSIDLFSFSGGSAAAKVLSLELGRGSGSAPDIGGAGSAAGGFGSIFGGLEQWPLPGTSALSHVGTLPLASASAAVAGAAGRGHMFSSGGGFRSPPRQPPLAAPHISQLLPVKQQQQQPGQVGASAEMHQYAEVPSMYELKHQMEHVKKLHLDDVAGAAGDGGLQHWLSPSSTTAQRALAARTCCQAAASNADQRQRPTGMTVRGVVSAHKSSTLPAALMRPSTAATQQIMPFMPVSLQSRSTTPQSARPATCLTLRPSSPTWKRM